MLCKDPLGRSCGFSFQEVSGRVQNPLKLSVVNLNFDVIFIMFKATTGNAVEDYEYNANKWIVLYYWPKSKFLWRNNNNINEEQIQMGLV